MANKSRWAATGHQRSSNRKLPERIRRNVLYRHPICWFRFPDICTIQASQVHHVVEYVDGGTDSYDNLVGVCIPCHAHHSAKQSQKRAVEKTWEWKRQPEKHPGYLD